MRISPCRQRQYINGPQRSNNCLFNTRQLMALLIEACHSKFFNRNKVKRNNSGLDKHNQTYIIQSSTYTCMCCVDLVFHSYLYISLFSVQIDSNK